MHQLDRVTLHLPLSVVTICRIFHRLICPGLGPVPNKVELFVISKSPGVDVPTEERSFWAERLLRWMREPNVDAPLLPIAARALTGKGRQQHDRTKGTNVE